MSAHVLLNLLNELGKSDKMRGLPSSVSLFRNEFNKFNNTGARMLDSFYHMISKLPKNHIFDVRTSIFCHLKRNIIIDVITLRYLICKPLVICRFYCMTLYPYQVCDKN